MLDALPFLILLQIVGLALAAGVLGGMLGVGGSTIIIPGLVFLLGRPTGAEQHLYQAAAMIANVAVSVPAALRHRRAGAINPEVLRWMLPAAVLCILLGVWLSNRPIFAGAEGGVWLGRVLAVFLVYVIIVNVRKLIRPASASPAKVPPGGTQADASTGDLPERARVTPARGLGVGAIMGTVAGLLGIGGGAVAVPLQQTLLRLPLRHCIANSSAIICVSAAIGAVYKNATLAPPPPPPGLAPDLAPGATAAAAEQFPAAAALPIDWTTGLTLGLILAPAAWAGGRLGAALTHTLPLRAIRLAFVGLMVLAAWKMADL
jgi:uncharacterized membrane protein YfcA